MTADRFSSYEEFIKIFYLFMKFTKDQATFHEKTLFRVQALKKCLERILCFDFRSQLLGWGTTFREIKVLSKMSSGVGSAFR